MHDDPRAIVVHCSLSTVDGLGLCANIERRARASTTYVVASERSHTALSGRTHESSLGTPLSARLAACLITSGSCSRSFPTFPLRFIQVQQGSRRCQGRPTVAVRLSLTGLTVLRVYHHICSLRLPLSLDAARAQFWPRVTKWLPGLRARPRAYAN